VGRHLTLGYHLVTPGYEMPFAGHPTLGTAHVARLIGSESSGRSVDAATLEMTAGLIPVAARGDLWTLSAGAAAWKEVGDGGPQLAAALGLDPSDLRLELLERYRSPAGRRFAYVFAEAGDGDVVARFLFDADDAVREDPATGSACANLGGWYLATGATTPLVRRVLQGDRIHRPSTLFLSVDAGGQVRVGGEVAWLGRGEITLDA
jgi:trans-2,3-dihydro-3-hydroxyanthranilate isomerase